MWTVSMSPVVVGKPPLAAEGLVVWLRDRVPGLPDPVVVVDRRRRRRHVPWPRGEPAGACQSWSMHSLAFMLGLTELQAQFAGARS